MKKRKIKKKEELKKIINDLRKTAIDLLKNGLDGLAFIVLKLLQFLLSTIIMGMIVGAFFVISVFANDVRRFIKDKNNVENSKIQESTILETKMKTSLSSNKKIISIDEIVIDSNNNGIKDSEDIVLDGELFPFMEPQKGDKVLYLKQTHFKKSGKKSKNTDKKIEKYLPLAVIGDEDVNIIKIPSNYYYSNQNAAKSLDIELFNNIFSKIKEKAPRE